MGDHYGFVFAPAPAEEPQRTQALEWLSRNTLEHTELPAGTLVGTSDEPVEVEELRALSASCGEVWACYSSDGDWIVLRHLRGDEVVLDREWKEHQPRETDDELTRTVHEFIDGPACWASEQALGERLGFDDLYEAMSLQPSMSPKEFRELERQIVSQAKADGRREVIVSVIAIAVLVVGLLVFAWFLP